MFHLRDIILLILNVQFICLSSPIEQSKSYVTSIFEGLGYIPVCVASTLASCEHFVKPDCNPNVPEFVTELKSLLQDIKYDIHQISAPEDTKKQEKILKLVSSEQSNILYIRLQNLINIIERQVTKNTAAIDEIKSTMNDLNIAKLEQNVSIKKLTENFTTFHIDLLAIKESMIYQKRLPSKIANENTSNLDTSKINENRAEDSFPYGVTTEYPTEENVSKPIGVLSDLTIDGGGWNVIQNRDALPVRENFYRGWNDYVKGFGDLNGEFWLGLDNIHELTTSTPMELRVDLEDYNGVKKWAKYDLFSIGDGSTKYVLTLGNYSGDAGDSLSSQHNGMKFSTYDHDNDNTTINCALEFRGAWWYNECHHSNLNGYHYVSSHSSYADGINWVKFKGYHYSLKKTSMKVRPISSN